jgi:hypothetical protein
MAARKQPPVFELRRLVKNKCRKPGIRHRIAEDVFEDILAGGLCRWVRDRWEGLVKYSRPKGWSTKKGKRIVSKG